MKSMSFFRRNIFWPFTAQMLLIGAFSFGAGYLSSYRLEETWQSIAIACGIFFLATAFLFWLKVLHPLKLIIHEMKALLTGKSYRKIYTEKRNEIGILAHFFNEMTKNLERILGQVKDHERLKKELNIAQKIQRDLLPEKAPDIPGLQILAKTRPASEIGGDTFNFFPSENRTLLYVGDSTGHGIPAGIVMIMVDTLITTFVKMFSTTEEILINLNKYLKPHLQTTMFMTLILLEWDHISKLKWVGAGHEYIIHYKNKDKSLQSFPSGGIAVGMLPDNSALIKEQSLDLEDNDFVILFSDGIVESKNIRGEVYTLKRLEQSIKSSVTPTTTAEEIFNKLALDVSRFMEGRPQDDDMTLIVIKKTQQKDVAADQSTTWSS